MKLQRLLYGMVGGALSLLTVFNATAFAQDASALRQGALNSVINNAFPLSPAEIQQYKATAAQVAQANAQPPGNQQPVGTSNIIPVTLKPGELMPVIRVGQGLITSVVFMDASGKIWPITSYTLGDPQAFNVNWDKQSGVLMIQGQKLYAQSNIGVMLQGMSVPVMLSLLIGQKQWDYLDYVRVSQSALSGNGKVYSVPEAPAYLNDLLMGVPPQGSQPLIVSSANAQAWSYQGNYLLLTRATLLSPAWQSHMSSGGADPYNAYVLPATPVILLSNQGKVESLKVSEESGNA